MKSIYFFIFVLVCNLQLKAQSKQNYISEAFALVKLKSFSSVDHSKTCEIITYIRTDYQFKRAKYILEVKNGTIGSNFVFSQKIDFNEIRNTKGLKGIRQKDDVYELSWGQWSLKENAMINLIILTEKGEKIVLPVEFTNYKNPITIMN